MSKDPERFEGVEQPALPSPGKKEVVDAPGDEELVYIDLDIPAQEIADEDSYANLDEGHSRHGHDVVIEAADPFSTKPGSKGGGGGSTGAGG